MSSLVSMTVSQASGSARINNDGLMSPPADRPATKKRTFIEEKDEDPNSFLHAQHHNDNNYEMSDHVDNSDWSDAEDADKFVPEWAREPNVSAALKRQALRDPDEIFEPFHTQRCDLREIFAGFKKKKRFHRRTSSGNWFKDRLHWKEELEYKRQMGFLD